LTSSRRSAASPRAHPARPAGARGIGLSLYDDKTHDDGKTRWRVNGQAFKGLSAGLTVSELCALYFSRTLLESLSGTPFRDDVESAFEKLSSVLTPHMRTFLDQLPRVIATKADPMRRHDHPRQQQFIARALEATLQLRQANLTYHSKSSERTKTYLVHPYRLAYALGGLYLLAYVPEYQEVRTFAVERIQDISLPRGTVRADRRAAGLGISSLARRPFRSPRARRDRVRAGGRRLHPGARVASVAAAARRRRRRVDADAGRLPRSRAAQLILSFGPFARVVAPPALAREIAEQFEEARARYAS